MVTFIAGEHGSGQREFAATLAGVRAPVSRLTASRPGCKLAPVRSKNLTITTGRTAGLSWRGILVALALVLASCETAPPVQEMSDARQAIAVAREAGAEDFAAAELGRAEAYLASAQQKLGRRAYAQARRDALAARNSALEALSVTDRARQDSQDD